MGRIIESLRQGDGFVAVIRTPQKIEQKFVAVLLQHSGIPNPADEKAAVDRLKEFSQEQSEGQPLSGDGVRQYNLAIKDNLPLAVTAALDASSAQHLFCCNGIDVYLQCCALLGVTRADHLQIGLDKYVFRDQPIQDAAGEVIISELPTLRKHIKQKKIQLFTGIVEGSAPAARVHHQPPLNLLPGVQDRSASRGLPVGKRDIPNSAAIQDVVTGSQSSSAISTSSRAKSFRQSSTAQDFIQALSRQRQAYRILIDRVKGYLKSHYMPVHLGHVQESDLSQISDDVSDGWDYRLPHKRMLFEYTLVRKKTGNVKCFVFMERDPETEVVRTISMSRRDPKDQHYGIHPYGLWFNPDRDAFDFSLLPYFEDLPDSVTKEGTLMHSWRVYELLAILPHIAVINNMGNQLVRYPAGRGSASTVIPRQGGREFYTVQPQAIMAYRRNELPTATRSTRGGHCDVRFAVGAHEVKAHDRRPPNSGPLAKKSVRVQDHTRGSKDAGVSTRIYTLRPPG